MELYVLSKQDLSILSICKLTDYEINLDEETNAKSTFTMIKDDGIEEGNFIVLNGLYRQFLFVIDEVNTEKESHLVTVTALDISNIFDRKVIEKNTDTMQTLSIEQFIANTMASNFVNSDDTVLNIGYIDITWYTNTQGIVPTNAEDGLYNFHTFLINCRQYKNIFTDFKFENGRLKIDIRNKQETTELIDTTLAEVTNYNKVYEEDVTAKVTVLIREDGSEYNLYLKTDKTTTTNKNDPNRASGNIEVISVDTADKAPEEALNVMKGNRYNHLVEFKIAKTSKLMDISKLTIGRPIRIKTTDDIYDSYISAITLTDENFVYFKSGNLRVTLIEKLKLTKDGTGNKIDKTGGTITGSLNVTDSLQKNGVNVLTTNDLSGLAPINSPAFTGTPTAPTPDTEDNSTKIATTEFVQNALLRAFPVGSIYLSTTTTNPSTYIGGTWQQIAQGRTLVGVDTSQTEFNTVKKTGGEKTHTLTINEMPAHTHGVLASGQDGSYNYALQVTTNNPKGGFAGYDASNGGGQAHNNLPPYYTCYIWLRTA